MLEKDITWYTRLLKMELKIFLNDTLLFNPIFFQN